jgi:hypothetical protein
VKALEEFAKQLATNLKEPPGWVPLLILLYFLVDLVNLPETVVVFGKPFQISSEFVVVGVTFLLYVIGDALDKPVFSRAQAWFLNEWLAGPRNEARQALVVDQGIYTVAKSLAIAAGRYHKISIHVCNELAKFFRSLSLPFMAIGLIEVVIRGWYPSAIVLIVLGLVLIPLYIFLKATHIRNLYKSVRDLKQSHSYRAKELEDVRLFFWDGVFVASAIRR